MSHTSVMTERQAIATLVIGALCVGGVVAYELWWTVKAVGGE